MPSDTTCRCLRSQHAQFPTITLGDMFLLHINTSVPLPSRIIGRRSTGKQSEQFAGKQPIAHVYIRFFLFAFRRETTPNGNFFHAPEMVETNIAMAATNPFLSAGINTQRSPRVCSSRRYTVSGATVCTGSLARRLNRCNRYTKKGWAFK